MTVRVGIYQSDSKGRCIYVNRILCRMLEISEADRVRLESRTIWVAAFPTALMEGATFKGRLGILTDITEAQERYLDDCPIDA